MPILPLKPCATPGCGELSHRRYCPQHRTAAARVHQREYSRMYYTQRWRRLRRLVLQRDPLCQACLAAGVTQAATEVDHIQPHRGDMMLAWSIDNLQSLCHRCHSRKTAHEVNARQG